jgi:hypothetical protein
MPFFEAIRRGIAEPTAAGPGGSDQPTFGLQMPVRTAASAPDPNNMARNLQPPPAPGALPPMVLPGGVYRGTPRPLPPPQTQTVPPQPAGIPQGWTTGVARLPGGDWANFEKNARPSANIEDYRRARGKPFIAQ